jgi:SAM-dependent methyltransferase
MRLYRELARWYPLITRPEDYAEEAAHIAAIIDALRDGPAHTLLELGAGAGANASHLKAAYRCTLTDISADMLDLSRKLNPECEHIEGDMRTLRLGRMFDTVLIHDAIDYMVTEADLQAAIETAAIHLREGGVAIFIPDAVKDDFAPATQSGGHDAADGGGVRYLEWCHDPDPSDTQCVVDYALMIREPGKPVRVEHDCQTLGLFERRTWLRLIGDAGLAPATADIPDPHEGEHAVFTAIKKTVR